MGHSNHKEVKSDHPPQQKENRQTAATVWRHAAFRKTQIPSVFSLTESLPKRKIFFLWISKIMRRFSCQ